MKKLFKTGSFVTIDDFTSLRITGPYALLTLGPDFATIECGEYTIEATGTELMVDSLSEEVAIFTFTTITNMTIRKTEREGSRHDS